jgi:hypothetical protein
MLNGSGFHLGVARKQIEDDDDEDWNAQRRTPNAGER